MQDNPVFLEVRQDPVSLDAVQHIVVLKHVVAPADLQLRPRQQPDDVVLVAGGHVLR